MSEVPLAEQLRGLRSGDFCIGFAHTADVGDGIVAEPICWQDPLVVALPARHALLRPQGGSTHELRGILLSCAIPRCAKATAASWRASCRIQEHKLNVVEEVSSRWT